MTDPSKERIAAALALADGLSAYWEGKKRRENEPMGNALLDQLDAYHATLPRLRTRAEVDAEIAKTARVWVDEQGTKANIERWDYLQKLCAEPTSDK